MSIRIAIAEHHTLIRKGLIELLNKHGNFTVEIEAQTGQELLNKYARKPTVDVCLIDINLPKKNGMETIKELKAKWPQVKTLALSTYNNDYVLIKILESASDGYMHKSATPEELYKALIAIHNNNVYYPKNILRKAASLKSTSIHAHSAAELEFTKYCCTELTYKEIADKMNVSVRTIDNYREALFKRLQLVSRTGLVLYAVRMGIISVEELRIDI